MAATSYRLPFPLRSHSRTFIHQRSIRTTTKPIPNTNRKHAAASLIGNKIAPQAASQATPRASIPQDILPAATGKISNVGKNKPVNGLEQGNEMRASLEHAQSQQQGTTRVRIDPSSREYKAAARRVTIAMVAAPIVIVTSYVLAMRFWGGVEQKTIDKKYREPAI